MKRSRTPGGARIRLAALTLPPFLLASCAPPDSGRAPEDAGSGTEPGVEAPAAGGRAAAPHAAAGGQATGGQATETATGGQATDEAEVLDELRRYYEALSARDWEALRDHFWPGATLATVWQPPGETAPRVVVSTLDDFIAAAPLGPGSKPIFEEWMTGAEVTRRGDLAQVWARYGARFGDPGDVMEWTGIDAFTLFRHDGRWRIVSLSYVGDDGRG